MAEQQILLTIDAIVFGYESKKGISVLLIKRKYEPFKDEWALPGGFVNNDESLEEAVERELREETGVSLNYLEQLYTFGNPKRDPRQRVVTSAYYGLVKQSDFELYASTDAKDAKWFNINQLPKLAFDHKEILEVAVDRLRGKIRYEPIGFELLDDKFPFSDLHNLYEAILGVELDRRNFKKKILQLNILDELEEKVNQGKGRPGNLFKFNTKNYHSLKQKGITFDI